MCFAEFQHLIFPDGQFQRWVFTDCGCLRWVSSVNSSALLNLRLLGPLVSSETVHIAREEMLQLHRGRLGLLEPRRPKIFFVLACMTWCIHGHWLKTYWNSVRY